MRLFHEWSKELHACREAVALELGVDASSLQLSMGMSSDYEHAVCLFSPHMPTCQSRSVFIADNSGLHQRPRRHRHLWQQTVKEIRFQSSACCVVAVCRIEKHTSIILKELVLSRVIGQYAGGVSSAAAQHANHGVLLNLNAVGTQKNSKSSCSRT